VKANFEKTYEKGVTVVNSSSYESLTKTEDGIDRGPTIRCFKWNTSNG